MSLPPRKSDQPTDDERLAAIRLLRESIASARGKIESTAARTVMRRLSNREYENTIATLFGRQQQLARGYHAVFARDAAERPEAQHFVAWVRDEMGRES